MSYALELENKLDFHLTERDISFTKKKMMGGLCYMVDEKMCVGIVKDDLMARIGPEAYEGALDEPGCREMDFTKRPMKGYVFVDEAQWTNTRRLNYWIDLALDFNPLAKSSKKKKKSEG